MSTSKSKSLSKPALGEPERRLRLKGTLSTPAGAALPAELWLTVTGLWLVALGEGGPAHQLDVLDASTVTYKTKLLGDRLQVDDHEVGIPTGKGGEAQRLIALARLRQKQPFRWALGEVLEECPFSAKRSVTERAWLAGWMAEDDRLLLWLDTSSNVEVESAVIGKEQVEQSYVVTEQQAALVAIGALGDVLVTVLEAPKLDIEDKLGRGAVMCGEHRWQTTLTNESDYREVASVYAAKPAQRSSEAARVAWLKSGGKGDTARWAAALLGERADRGDAWARLLVALLFEERPPLGLLRPVSAQREAAPNLVRWAEAWGIGAAKQQALVDGFRHVGAAACAGALHQHLWKAANKADPSPTAGVARDQALARDLAAAGQASAAADVLEEALKRLPPPHQQELLAHAAERPDDGVLAMRAALWDQLIAVSEDSGRCHLSAARAFPLDRARVAQAAAVDGEMQGRARVWLACLAPKGLQRDTLPPQRAQQSWTVAQCEGGLLHPVQRSGAALSALQAHVAEAAATDHSSLKSYCEVPDKEAAAAALNAVARAAAALEMATPQLLVARGERAIGVCAFDGGSSFVIVGDRHLPRKESDADNDAHMSAAELSFALGAEMAQLRFGHARVSSHDRWRGVIESDEASVALAQQATILLEGGPFGGVAGALTTAAQRQTDTTASVLWPAHSGDACLDPALTGPLASFVLARRAVQLSADRVGLLLAGDIAASVRAIVKTSPRYHADLALLDDHGLATVLAQRQEDGRLRHAHLAVRVGALAAFWLSDEYDVLLVALVGAA